VFVANPISFNDLNYDKSEQEICIINYQIIANPSLNASVT